MFVVGDGLIDITSLGNINPTTYYYRKLMTVMSDCNSPHDYITYLTSLNLSPLF